MDRKILLAFALSLLLIMGYQSYNAYKANEYIKEHPEYLEELEKKRQERQLSNRQEISEKPSPTEKATIEESVSNGLLPIVSPTVGSTIPEASGEPFLFPSPAAGDISTTEEIIVVNSPLYRVEIAAQGGSSDLLEASPLSGEN